jgi:hypothetical protein
MVDRTPGGAWRQIGFRGAANAASYVRRIGPRLQEHALEVAFRGEARTNRIQGGVALRLPPHSMDCASVRGVLPKSEAWSKVGRAEVSGITPRRRLGNTPSRCALDQQAHLGAVTIGRNARWSARLPIVRDSVEV